MTTQTTRLLGQDQRVAAIVPCHNEEVAIGTVVRDLRAAVPQMTVYVYDNCSTDRTAEVAAAAGAVVRHEHLKGKGNVVRRAFADIDADIYLLIDGDDTYDATAAPDMINALLAGPYDHVLGVRKEIVPGAGAYRPAHEAGNRFLNKVVASVFGHDVGDMLSGYRVFSRRFVKSFPAVSREFEIETELTVHCLALRIPSTSVEVDFKDRPAGSESKLRTYRDGWKILNVIASLTRHERPITFYGLISLLCLTGAAALGTPVLLDYLHTGLVPRLPALIIATVLLITALLGIVTGAILDGIRKARHETSRTVYTGIPGPAVGVPAPAAPAAAPRVPSPVRFTIDQPAAWRASYDDDVSA